MESFARIIFCTIAVMFFSFSCSEEEETTVEYPLESLKVNEVKITGGFWEPVIKISRENTLPHILNFCETTGRIENFKRAAGLSSGPHIGERYNDTDLFKTIEGASYHLMHDRNDTLETYIDSLIRFIVLAQEEDGYLYTPRTINPDTDVPGAGRSRWEDVWISHELYNAGHLYEAAVAYFEATGKKALLDVALKNANLVISIFNDEGLQLAPGHQEIEIGLVKLFKVSGEKKYLDQAMFFLDQRGKPVDREPVPRGTRFEIYNEPSYLQYHLPVRQQKELMGHAVRAMYMCSGMSDAGVYSGDTSLINTAGDLWDDMVSSKLYITGGIGASSRGEAFSEPYDLPNATAYCETCAAAGSLFWNLRMFNLTASTKYLDVLETVLYNGFLSGVSLDGKKFFYPNPLESNGKYERSEWFGVACCPGNVARVIPSLNQYVYSKNENTLFVNLYIESEAEASFYGNKFQFRQETNFPRDGKVRLIVSPEKPARLKISFRIPGWSTESFLPGELYKYLEKNNHNRVEVRVNGKKVKYGYISYVILDRKWRKGDIIEFELPMETRLVVADERVESDHGKAALVRGPIVYAFESVDNPGNVFDLELSKDMQFTVEFRDDLLNGVTILKSEDLQAIPYYSWANRGLSEMSIWLPLKD